MTPDDLQQYLRLVIALAFVLGLMALLPVIFKKLGLSTNPGGTATPKRLKLIEVLPLDARRRLALIQRDDKEHLVILGPNGETVIETGIKQPESNAKKKKSSV